MIEMPNLVLKPLGLVINGTVINEASLLEQLLGVFGNPNYRNHELEDQGRQWRKFIILDEIGVRFLFDHEIGRVIDIHLCFQTSKTVTEPTSVFSGVLFVNGVRLVRGMKERLLPKSGEFVFVKRGGWTAESNFLFVNLRFCRRRKELEAVAVAFLRRPLFSFETKRAL
jgi:hypothetical protein